MADLLEVLEDLQVVEAVVALGLRLEAEQAGEEGLGTEEVEGIAGRDEVLVEEAVGVRVIVGDLLRLEPEVTRHRRPIRTAHGVPP